MVFCSVQEISVLPDSERDVVMYMKQQIGEVIIQAIVDENNSKFISGLKSELKGVANCFNILEEKTTGNESVSISMNPISGGYTSYYRLLGINEEETPMLSFHFLYTNGMEDIRTIDLSDTRISHFNYIKHETHQLTYYIEITQDGSSFNASIQNWNEKTIHITPTTIN